MARLYHFQEQFNAGKLGKLMRGRSDTLIYKQGCKELKNWRPTIQGPVTKRKGTKYAYEVKTSTKKTRLIKFIFSETDNFTLEFGDAYIRFIKNTTQIESGGSPYEIVSPYLEADLPNIKYAQVGDIVYLAHPSYKPRKLTRIADNNWTLTEMDYKFGPVQDFNETATTINLSGTLTVGASSTWTASASLFVASDVGSVWAIAKHNDKTVIGYAKMTAYTSATEATFENQSDLTAISGSPSTHWKKPYWSGTFGYPRAVAFHEQRLFFGGTNNDPLTVWGSVSNGAYENFDAGTAQDDDALIFELSGQINTIQWLKSDGLFLTAGTLGGLAFIGSSSVNSALTPTNVKANVGNSYGSNAVQGIILNDRIVYAHSNSKALYEAIYNDTTLKYAAIDLNDYNPEILTNGVDYLDTLEQPDLTAVCVSGGKLMMLSRDEPQKILGWYEYEINGYVESIATIPTTGDDRIMMIVRRTINGNTKRYIEYIELDEDIYLDSAKTYSGSATRTLSGLSHLEGQTVSVLGNGSYSGDYVVTSGVVTIPTSKTAVTEAVIGLSYNADLEIMPISIPVAQTGGTTQTLKSRIVNLELILSESRGLYIGKDFSNLIVLPTRNSNTAMGSPPEQQGADYPEVISDIGFNGGYTYAPTVCIRNQSPFGSTIIAFMATMEVEAK